MRPPLLIGLLLALTAPTGLASAAAAASSRPAAAPQAAPNTVEVTLDQSQVTTFVGARLTVESRVANTGPASTDPLVAHLNVASMDGTYVDLEDWSADVTRPLAPLAPASSTTLSWEFQAVNVGSFDVYVVVLPDSDSSAGTGPLVASPPVHITVEGRRTLTAAGALPVVIAIPILLALVAAGARYRIRRPD